MDPLPSDKKQHGKTSQQLKKLHSSSKKVAKLQGRWQNFKEGGKTSRNAAKLAELMIFILNLFPNFDPPGPSNKKFTRSGPSTSNTNTARVKIISPL